MKEEAGVKNQEKNQESRSQEEDGLQQKRRELLLLAYEAQKRAYVPYSGFAVGAALETCSGRVFLGCNIENAAYTPTNCAERTAFFKAISEGERTFARIAIAGNPVGKPGTYCAPCGVCRQVMAEFCDRERFEIILGKSDAQYRVFRLKELLPEAFGPGNLFGRNPV